MSDKWADYKKQFCGCKDASRFNSCRGLQNCELPADSSERKRTKVQSDPEAEPVAEHCAEIIDGWRIVFAGRGPIAPIVERHGLRIGSKLYAVPPASADAVSVPRELLNDEGLEAIQELASGEDQTVNIGQVQGDFDEHIESTAGYTVRLMKQLRALLAQSQEVKS